MSTSARQNDGTSTLPRSHGSLWWRIGIALLGFCGALFGSVVAFNKAKAALGLVDSLRSAATNPRIPVERLLPFSRGGSETIETIMRQEANARLGLLILAGGLVGVWIGWRGTAAFARATRRNTFAVVAALAAIVYAACLWLRSEIVGKLVDVDRELDQRRPEVAVSVGGTYESFATSVQSDAGWLLAAVSVVVLLVIVVRETRAPRRRT